MTHPPILTIAGSDSGGGAGIQADLKTIQALGGYGMSAITAITVQNTQGVFAVQEVLPEIVAGQIGCVLSDIGAAAIKTGMLANAAIISAVSDALITHQQQAGSMPPLVIDPVMVAKGGTSLLAAGAVQCLIEKLLPLAAVVTPNIPEAEQLSGVAITSIEAMMAAARRLIEKGAAAVIIKGGHLDTGDGMVHNLLLQGDPVWQVSPRIDTENTHGSGCSFAAALATRLGFGDNLQAAFTAAGAYVAGAILHAYPVGQGHGPLHHTWNFFPDG